MAERSWQEIGAKLDRATGRRFPPIAGPGRGYRLDGDPGQLTPAEIVARLSYEAAMVSRSFVFVIGVGFAGEITDADREGLLDSGVTITDGR